MGNTLSKYYSEDDKSSPAEDEVINPITTEAITPAKCNSVPLITAVSAPPTVCATTDGDDAVNPITAKVITPTNYSLSGSSFFSKSSSSFTSEEDLDE